MDRHAVLVVALIFVFLAFAGSSYFKNKEIYKNKIDSLKNSNPGEIISFVYKDNPLVIYKNKKDSLFLSVFNTKRDTFFVTYEKIAQEEFKILENKLPIKKEFIEQYKKFKKKE